MSVFGIGIDIVEVERIASAIERHGDAFLDRIFTAGERSYCEAAKRPALHYAARFAAKEAVSKALGTGIGGDAGFRDLEVICAGNGAPALRMSGAAARFASEHSISEVKISLTHDRHYAAANAVAIRSGGPVASSVAPQ